MTSEELIILLDSLQSRLPKCANQVLLRLVAKCILNGSNRVPDSSAQLARELGMAEDSVKVARRALAGIVESTYRNGVGTEWILPADWFVVQRSLFAVSAPVENWSNRPGNQGAPPWKPGHEAPQKPGRTATETRAAGLETRAHWTSFQGATTLETREVPTEDQQLTSETTLETRASSIDRDRDLSSHHHSVTNRDSIEGVNWLPEEMRDHGEQLKRWLRFYFAQTRPHDSVPDGPDEVILAKCLAIGGLARLQHVLGQLMKKHTRPGDTWAWFVTVFCQRVHSSKNVAGVRAPEGFRREKKPASSDGGAQFRTGLLQEVAAATGKMQ